MSWSHFLPPLCLLLALTMLILGFALLAIDSPTPNVELHQATAAGNEDYQHVLENQLERQKWGRTFLLVGLFGGSALMVLIAFLSMRR